MANECFQVQSLIYLHQPEKHRTRPCYFSTHGFLLLFLFFRLHTSISLHPSLTTYSRIAAAKSKAIIYMAVSLIHTNITYM